MWIFKHILHVFLLNISILILDLQYVNTFHLPAVLPLELYFYFSEDLFNLPSYLLFILKTIITLASTSIAAIVTPSVILIVGR